MFTDFVTTDTESLVAFCRRLEGDSTYIAVDTEFVREKTYRSRLCLIQIADAEEARCIDPLAHGIDLNPLCDLMMNPKITKVFHAARQDIEIFLEMIGSVPTPLFDTQIAAMVCGFGDSVSYEVLVNKLTKAKIDKSIRFTDWSQRPLSKQQIQYALDDVTYLRLIYAQLYRQLESQERLSWLNEELNTLTDPATYHIKPQEIWRKLRPISNNPRFLAILRELAAWRELEAQDRNLPRQHIIRDEAIMELATIIPSTVEELARVRFLSKRTDIMQRYGQEIMAAITRGSTAPLDQCPVILPKKNPLPTGVSAIADLLRVLLKMKCSQHCVAQRLIASVEDLEKIACGNYDVPSMYGWRWEIFGADALRVRRGELALTFSPLRQKIELISVIT